MIPAPHLHLIINHIPLLGMLYGAFLLVVYFFRQNLGSVLLIALGLILISALFSVPTFYSGEWAEDIVENQSHVSETFIHEHEESAEITVWFLAAAGLLSFPKNRFQCNTRNNKLS
jgi:putative Mn2+ efflux pump MntP